jgi:hypothetical protein
VTAEARDATRVEDWVPGDEEERDVLDDDNRDTARISHLLDMFSGMPSRFMNMHCGGRSGWHDAMRKHTSTCIPKEDEVITKANSREVGCGITETSKGSFLVALLSLK